MSTEVEDGQAPPGTHEGEEDISSGWRCAEWSLETPCPGLNSGPTFYQL